MGAKREMEKVYARISVERKKLVLNWSISSGLGINWITLRSINNSSTQSEYRQFSVSLIYGGVLSYTDVIYQRW